MNTCAARHKGPIADLGILSQPISSTSHFSDPGIIFHLMTMAVDMVPERTKIYRFLVLARTGCLECSVKTVIRMLLINIRQC